MTDTAARAQQVSPTPEGLRGRLRELTSAALPPAGRRTGTRHPLVATAMATPLAVLLAVACGGWHAVVVQASSVAGLMGR